MRSLLLNAAIIFISLTPCYAVELNKPSEIYIIQSGVEKKVLSQSISIKKSEFSFKFVFYKNPKLRINISDNDNVFKAATKRIDQIYLFPFYPGRSFAESYFNPDKDLIINDRSNHYWYYVNDTESRFNSVKIENDKYICIRTVKNIYDIQSDQLIDISKIKQKALYITIVRNSDIIQKKTINFNPVINDKTSMYYDFAKWAFDNSYADTSVYEDEFAEEIERVCFKIEFID